jgi:hypothetical protein
MKTQKSKKTSLYFGLAMLAAGLFLTALDVAQDKDALERVKENRQHLSEAVTAGRMRWAKMLVDLRQA